MTRLPVECPSCSEAIRVTRLECPGCATKLEGEFELPALLKLPSDDLAFVTEFVRSSGSLKEMAKLNGQSYPTIRNRLDQIIARLDKSAGSVGKRQHEILDDIAKGKITVKQAAKLLREVK